MSLFRRNRNPTLSVCLSAVYGCTCMAQSTDDNGVPTAIDSDGMFTQTARSAELTGNSFALARGSLAF
jgi:hypothetical protein